MIFPNWQKILSGEQTQTRRLVKPGDSATKIVSISQVGQWTSTVAVLTPLHRLNPTDHIHKVLGKWEVGKTYAVQPARTAKAVGRIRVTGIRREDVRTISESDVQAEGFSHRNQFLETWTHMHDTSADGYLTCELLAREYRREKMDVPQYAWKAWTEHLKTRPDNRYVAWVLCFELVKS